ncbi:bumetanide-sensitive sodium-(potassium)-chloride cotransporter isoform X1 [Eupeodes corollae]|uniref:bumetanide-sensitive sodium-(potassium)-chloride cotransporter isoform X1 n=1 Tax=Eupeodes corollae TaxID=290404 RepID=UPI002490B7C3|nr:bumetanide-sensitive sodium-(potassium)-chloride cotransporter isoform X1 [Eupeodes corollae]
MTERFSISKVNMNGGSAGGGESEKTNGNPVDVVGDLPSERNSTSPGVGLKRFSLLHRNVSQNNEHDESNSRKFSLAQLTREALPRLDNYRTSKRNLKRPSIGELHGEETLEPRDLHAIEDSSAPNVHSIKLGWIVGVVIPCLLNIFGVMLFLRLSWVVAQSGLLQSLAIIGVSAVVCIITTTSLSAISTNGEVKGGGIYFIISRSLGPEFGASVGVVFAFANAVAASMNTIGFCDSLNDLLRSNGLKIIDGGINDVRIVGVFTILILILICCIGMEWEVKAQNFLIAIIVLAIFNFLIGAAIGPQGDPERIAKGFVGFSWATVHENLGPSYRYSEGTDQNFFSVFAIFFPSVTGIQAGANISGDLRNAGKSIPKGTMLALIISMITYGIFVVFAGSAALRDASGNVSDLVNGTLLSENIPCRFNNTCEYGLANSYSIMQLMSVWGPLIYAGCFAATLSTALTNLLSVPRLVQSLGTDQIYPGLIYFSKPYGKHGEPYRGYVLTFLLSAGFLLIGELNVIAPMISNFYLASYALINFCTFHAALIKPLGWRPTFKYYNVWLSLFGFVLCVAIMFLIEWKSSLITLIIIFALYLIVVYRKPDVNWGDSTQAQTYKTALSATQKLNTISDHVKNYHPQVLVLAGNPKVRPPLIDLGSLITKNTSLMMVGKIVPLKIGYKNRKTLIEEGQKYLDARKIKAFYNVIDGFTMEDGTSALIKASGFGKLTPNIVLMGYKNDWRHCRKEEVSSYFEILHNAFSLRMGVAILRVPDGLDFSELNHEIRTPAPAINGNALNHLQSQGVANMTIPHMQATSDILHVDSNLNLPGMISATSTLTVPQPPPMPNMSNLKKLQTTNDSIIYSTKGGSELPKDILDAVTVFARKQPKGTIDVWWMYDDGGLTMLLPYIISMRSNWSNCKLRVFALTNRRLDLEEEEKSMSSLLQKLRINYSSLVMLQGVTDRPRLETITRHRRLLDGFVQSSANPNGSVTEEEIQSLEEKTYRQLRIHELLVDHSSKASLVVMSLPMPRREAISPPLYMSWLEMLTSDISCPFILARGNQTPVLTFYS